MKENDSIKKYPELDKIVDNVTDITCMLINRLARDVESTMPYKAQYVLEYVIDALKARV